MRGHWALLVFLLVWPATAFGQAWTRNAGQTYVDFGATLTRGNNLFRPDFSVTPLGTTYTQLSINAYAEAGLIDRWLTASFSGELFRLNELDDLGRTYGVGDLRVGLWSGLVTAPLRITFGVWVGVPTGDATPEGNDPTTNLIAQTLPTGDGEWDFEPQIVIGKSFAPTNWPLNHYIQGSVGYHIRTKGTDAFGTTTDFADAFTYRLEFGTQPKKGILERFWLTLRLSGVESFASNDEAAGGASGLGNGVTYTAAQFRLFMRLVDTFGAAIAVDGAFRARSVIAAPSFKFSLSYEFDLLGRS